tara:strand:- start:11244 stop:11576 length:333 start_codon:yes stop_codon:yes gene_type:complete
MTFNSLDDVWNIIDLLIDEIRENEGDFDEDKSLVVQIPFFTCPNHFYTADIGQDIQRYTYCKDNNVQPYSGSYGEQPARWVKRHFTIKSAFAKKEGMMIDKQKAKAKSGK